MAHGDGDHQNQPRKFAEIGGAPQRSPALSLDFWAEPSRCVKSPPAHRPARGFVLHPSTQLVFIVFTCAWCVLLPRHQAFLGND